MTGDTIGSHLAHSYGSPSATTADKDLIGRWIIKISIFFIVLTSFCPFALLFYNSIIIQQPHSIWWLKPHLHPVGWRRKPAASIRGEIDDWPLWAQRQRARNAQFDDLVDLAFCSDQMANKERPLFPLGEYHPAKNLYEPWIMDAVVSDRGSLVSILVADAKACQFDMDAWQSLVSSVRQAGYAKATHALANGSHDAVNVLYPPSLSSDRLFTGNMFVGSRVTCRFYDRKSLLIGTVQSFKIIAGMIIRCPIPPSLRIKASSTDDRLHIRLSIPIPSASSHRRRLLASTNLRGGHREAANASTSISASRLEGKDHVLSPMFGVCPLAASRSLSPVKGPGNRTANLQGSEAMIEEDRPAYNISICSSTVSRSKIRLVEWIEYHRMIGIDHFFIYDRYIRSLRSAAWLNPSSPRSRDADDKDDEADDDDDDDNANYEHRNESIASASNSSRFSSRRAKDSLFEILRDYIDYGIVTVVPWPYKDCVDNMACDRSLQHHEFFFDPPPKLQKRIALQSCYLRFQSSSRYMALLDDKDFLVFSNINSSSTMPRLPSLIAKLEASHHHMAAIEFQPSAAIDCPGNDSASEIVGEKDTDEEGSSQPSRYGIWKHFIDLSMSNKKIIANTALVSSASQSHALVVEIADDPSANLHLQPGAADHRVSDSGSESKAYAPRLGRHVARRGMATSRDDAVYSLAQVDVNEARILEYRHIDDHAGLCDRALFEYRSLDEICQLAFTATNIADHFSLDELTVRYTHGMAGDILE